MFWIFGSRDRNSMYIEVDLESLKCVINVSNCNFIKSNMNKYEM